MNDPVMVAFLRFKEHQANGPEMGAVYNSRKKWGYIPDVDNICPQCEPVIKRTKNAWYRSRSNWRNAQAQHDLLAAWNHCCTVRHIAGVLKLTKQQELELRRIIRATKLMEGVKSERNNG